MKSTDYNEKYSNAQLVQNSVLNYVSDNNGTYPLGDSAKTDKLVMNSLFDEMGSGFANVLKDGNLYKYFVFNIQSSKLSIDDKLNSVDVEG